MNGIFSTRNGGLANSFLLDRGMLEASHRVLAQDTGGTNYSGSETQRVKYALYISLVFFFILLVTFEFIRHIKQLFLKRITRKFQKNNRVPAVPPRYFLGWVPHILRVSEAEFLHMVGLDGYIFLRFIKLCLKISCFYSFWGVLILLPIYSSANGDLKGWGALTLGNVIHQNHALRLWWPAIFSYIFAFYVCRLLYQEYDLFVHKRLEYLIRGDPDTHPQTYYTLMVENIPSEYRSVPALQEFFDTLFPESVYSVSAVLKLQRLESMCETRRQTRNNIELSVAKKHALSAGMQPYIWVPSSVYIKARAQLASFMGEDDESDNTGDGPLPPKASRSCCGMMKVPAIEHYTFMLYIHNKSVGKLQRLTALRAQELNELETQNLLLAPNIKSRQVLEYLASATDAFTASRRRERGMSTDSGGAREDGITMSLAHNPVKGGGRRDSMESLAESVDDGVYPPHGADEETEDSELYRSLGDSLFMASYEKLENTRTTLAAESVAAAELAKEAALQKLLEAKKVLGSLTVRNYFRMSSTAFVTFTSRVSAGVAHQMLLSHDNHEMQVAPAPSVTDVIWSNMYAKKTKIDARTHTASAALIVGAIFWSFVVTGVRGIFNLQTLDKNHNNHSFLSMQEGSATYMFFNDYLAVGILLTLLAILPLIFDFIARKYERLRTESSIQGSIMTRYFAYMLANVYVNITADSILASVKTIFSNPGSVLNVLGESLPDVSALFACMIILYTFVGLMVEFIRAWPMICFYTLTMFHDKRRCTRRQLRTGAFAAARMLYGWIYPCLLLIFMIIMIYSCIAPLISLLAIVYYAFAFVMYKYQLLYVYVNEYQSGGQMWYTIFNMCMISLLCGVVTLMGFLASKKELLSGPFYFVTPLPALVAIFWRYCNNKFHSPSVHAGTIDKYYRISAKRGLPSPLDAFDVNAFRQPSLTEPNLYPEPYRLRSTSVAVNMPTPNRSSTYNTLHQSSAVTIVPTSIMTAESKISTAAPRSLLSGGDLERAEGGRNGPVDGSLDVQRQLTDDDMDNEQLDLCVNDILEGLSNIEEVPI